MQLLHTSSKHTLSIPFHNASFQTLYKHTYILSTSNLLTPLKSNSPFKVLTAGGGSKNDMWTKMRARLLQVPESLPSYYTMPCHATSCDLMRCDAMHVSYTIMYPQLSFNCAECSSLLSYCYDIPTLVRSLTVSGAHVPGYQRRCCLWLCKTCSQVLFPRSSRQIRATRRWQQGMSFITSHLITSSTIKCLFYLFHCLFFSVFIQQLNAYCM